ncbi:leucine-rich repeat containing protein [Thecamonas trahens ATCC 50062]|uniref:Leucine-rich repeat containing protein n=1 Tax=Thecamonas trahens ATCC 50062 TaxID=461836 RepID=A0A0L0D851_THETB|nr:leucine-rich repeat containing protein [Thecamonas trahens ATCC 50062]KNC48241.1 leucine-rich repeat containing protein [Thecamonas trahens ATCC 50062]|eukprot:XP_013758810.1 leucine-rich repeat containing protein [Thecamonas trahens ATCC 50062]
MSSASSSSSPSSSSPSSSSSRFFSNIVLQTDGDVPVRGKATPTPTTAAMLPPSLSYSSDYEEDHARSFGLSSSSSLDSEPSSTHDSVFGPAEAAGLKSSALPKGFDDLRSVHRAGGPSKRSSANSRAALAFLAGITPEFFDSQWAVAAAEKTVLALRSFARTGAERLDLSFVGLGLVPLELVTLLANVPSLERLILHGNEIRSLPACVQELSSLTHLDLSRNMLEELHPAVGRLDHLRILDLRWNKLETLPSQVGRLTTLRQLLLASNSLVHLPSSLEGLTNLEVLDLYHNHLPQLAPAGSLAKLTSLDVSRNALSLPARSLEALSQLTELSLHSNGLRRLSKAVGSLSSLTSLVLYGNKLTHLPESLCSLAALTHLNVRNNRLVYLPAALGACTSLVHLNVRSNSLVALPSSIGRCGKLELLNAADNALVQLTPALGKCSSLEVINVAHNKLTTLPTSLKDLPHLIKLDAAHNPLHSLPANALGYISFHNLSPWRLARTLLLPLWLMGSEHMGLGSALAVHAATTLLPLLWLALLVGSASHLFGDASADDGADSAAVWGLSVILAIYIVGLGLVVAGYEAVVGTASTMWPAPFTVRLSKANVAMAAVAVIQALQLVVLCVRTDLGWPASLSQVAQVLVLSFEDLVPYPAYLSFALACVWAFSYRLLVEVGLFTFRGRFADSIAGLLALVDPLLFLPTIRNLISPLVCSYWSDRAPTLAADVDVQCWSGSHLGAAGVALVGLAVYYPAAVFGAGPWLARVAADIDVRREPKPNSWLRQLVFFAAVGTAFFEPGKQPAVYLAAVATAAAGAVLVVGRTRPYGLYLWKLNILEMAAYAIVFVAAMLTIWVKVDDITSPWMVFTVLCVVAALIAAAAVGIIGVYDALDVYIDSDELSFGDHGEFGSLSGGGDDSSAFEAHMLPATDALITQMQGEGLGSDFDYDEYAADAGHGYEFDGARLVYKHSKVDPDDELKLARNPMYTTMAWGARKT